MELDFFRNIGQTLYKRISSSKPQFNKTSLGRGASGDMTFPIDKLAEDMIIERFEKEGFSFNIIAEERGTKILKDNNLTLIIDPIDGSKNAVSGIPFFSTSIAITDGSELNSLKFGYIINLTNADEFYAQRGKGAFFNGEKIITQENEKSIIVAFESSNPYSGIQKILPLFKIASRVRCYGSTALDLAYLSIGAISIFVTATPSRIFDFSAGILIAKEVGAFIRDLDGKPIETLPVKFDTKTTLLVCGSETLYSKAIKALGKE